MSSTSEHDDWRPRAIVGDFVESDLGEEVLVYDRRLDQAHTLSPGAAAVWHAADGTRTIADLAADVEALGFERDLAVDLTEVALSELEGRRLIVPAPPGREGLTRRQLLGRLGVGAATFAAVPVVGGIVTPAAAGGTLDLRLRELLTKLFGIFTPRPPTTTKPTPSPTKKPTKKPTTPPPTTETPEPETPEPETPEPETPAP